MLGIERLRHDIIGLFSSSQLMCSFRMSFLTILTWSFSVLQALCRSL